MGGHSALGRLAKQSAAPAGDPLPLISRDQPTGAGALTSTQVLCRPSGPTLAGVARPLARHRRRRDVRARADARIKRQRLQPPSGDLIGTGTLSTASDDGLGSLMEISHGGKQPLTLPSGETRSFLEDGDEVVMRAWCERDGAVRIGLGECSGRVVA